MAEDGGPDTDEGGEGSFERLLRQMGGEEGAGEEADAPFLTEEEIQKWKEEKGDDATDAGEGNGHVVRIEVVEGERGERVDAVLAARLSFVPPVTRSRVQRAIKAGCVQLNGEVVAKPSLKLAPGDLLLWDDAEFVLPTGEPQPQQQGD